ncbi:hypothetical protein GCM10010435_30670 [Winogradskya consettensis]|uniref:Uncharacterized protein n=1 Tax=Winogradskya consettensis TaxID=113560 RepID=A0A919SEU2_9ACTN|nr:hypothetical protein [Actinoplanes consettensis]GIM70546.1 hypothetical protein Aco04nite_20830 [Actinoplanes consettensis]
MRSATPWSWKRCASILGLLVELAITGVWEVSMAASGLISQIDGEVDPAQFCAGHAQLRAAMVTADDERREEVIRPLLELFDRNA